MLCTIWIPISLNSHDVIEMILNLVNVIKGHHLVSYVQWSQRAVEDRQGQDWVTNSLKSSVCSHLGTLCTKSSQFEHNHRVDEFLFEKLQTFPQVRFRRGFRGLPETVMCCWQECKQQADVLSEWIPVWENIPGQSMRETRKEAHSEKQWETLTWVYTCLKIGKPMLEF